MFKFNRMITLSIAIAAGLCLVTVSAPAMAQAPSTNDSPNPYLMADQTWISISGTAVDVQPASFTLDYGEGTVLVEMDDWDWYGDAYGILDGDKVTVYGEIDDDFYETTSIEASSVYVENLGTYFYANSADEEGYEGYYDYWVSYAPIVVGQTTVRGTVTSKMGREFTVDTGLQKMKVDTIAMPYNPMDDKGYQQIDVGDYVSVSGTMDYDFWEKRELMADSIITLWDD